MQRQKEQLLKELQSPKAILNQLQTQNDHMLNLIQSPNVQVLNQQMVKQLKDRMLGHFSALKQEWAKTVLK
jgi:hypothetical protein